MNKTKRLPSLLISLFIVVFIIIGGKAALYTSPVHEMTTLEDGWLISVNNSDFTEVSMWHAYKGFERSLVPGDHVIMKYVLPDTNLPNPVVLFRTRYTTLSCYIDGHKIFSYGDEYYKAGKFIGKMYHMISLPTDYAGKTLVFDMYAGEPNAFKSLHAPILGSHTDISGTFVRDNLIIIATGMFMFVFGLTFLCIAMVFVNFVPEVKSLLVGSLFCMNLAAWLLSYYNVLSFFIYTERESEIEYFTMYLVVPYCYWLLYYIKDLQKDRIYRAIMVVSISVPTLQYLLHYIFNIHLRVTLPMYHIVAILGFAVLLYYAVVTNKHIKEAPASTVIQLFGLLSFATGHFIHLIIYVLEVNNIKTNEIFNKAVISVACLVFAICQLATYLVYITATYAKRQENISLSHLAYADGLTNLANRSKADKLMEELNSASDDYCIMSIDLNGLKDVNDKFGHPAGDRYIKEFAKVLSNTFEEDDFYARIGGDEFLVVLRDAALRDIDGLIGRMNSALNVMNALYPEYKRSVSTGFAFRHECVENNSHEVYLLADQRMYENKRRMHQELGIRPRL
ncbi:MAG: GGDEF domain-containing protein [Butyrivibrio sp.]|uniref:GGDEF domain-containing protein n=1 Tax=Butyrivibrio sp. TaxID=28121 RepID=UPI0025C57DB5|nr:GGDEF domain-containing protein [Butyrivibrio sp.]MBQ6589770.1 GGDEF domain-containing protein [Butyrivibrio sp.]